MCDGLVTERMGHEFTGGFVGDRCVGFRMDGMRSAWKDL